MSSFTSFNPQRGRLFGDTSEWANLMFYPEMGSRGVPFLLVRGSGKGPDILTLKSPTALLIELDEHPGIPFLAWASMDGDTAIVQYTVVELSSSDVRELPPPGAVNLVSTR